MGKLSPCEDGSSSLKWVGGTWATGWASGSETKVEGWTMKQRLWGPVHVGRGNGGIVRVHQRWGKTRIWGGRDYGAFIDIHVASELCREQFVLHASGGEHGIGIWCEVRHGRVKTKG